LRHRELIFFPLRYRVFAPSATILFWQTHGNDFADRFLL
jgi:hypothetical protein